MLSEPGSAVPRVLAEIETLLALRSDEARPTLQLRQPELSRVSVLCRFNSLIVGFCLPDGRIYFPVRSPREFPFACSAISIICRHGLRRRTAWNGVLRSIFPLQGEPGRRLLLADLKSETHSEVLSPPGSRFARGDDATC